MVNTCRTSVRVGDDFHACGKPITQHVNVGLKVCGYCDKHAADARAFVERMGGQQIADIQLRVNA